MRKIEDELLKFKDKKAFPYCKSKKNMLQYFENTETEAYNADIGTIPKDPLAF